ncbi:MAG: DUF1918 domain-containing protein [Streptosporangiaceae bacterium]
MLITRHRTGGLAGIPRLGEIVAVTGPDGSPPYRVRWLGNTSR